MDSWIASIFRLRHLWLLVSLSPLAQGAVVTYPLPSCYKASDQLTLTANGTTVPMVATTAVYDTCNFSTDGAVTITITAKEPITSFNISPHSQQIAGTVEGNRLTFTLEKPSYVIVKINKLREAVIAGDSLETEAPPASGNRIHNITAIPYKADASGEQYATTAIQTAIDTANKAGGGIVYVPSGVFKCGNLILKSNVSLYLQGGAVVRGSGLPGDYTHDFTKISVGGLNGTWFVSTEPGAKNVKIFGRGTIDGNGESMRTTYGFLNHAVVPMACSNFTMDGVAVRDAGLWSVIPTRSNHVTIRNTKVYQENDRITENDAIDIQECQDVLVEHVLAISQDDAFSTKTWGKGSKEIGLKYPGDPQELRNVTFNDCIAWTRYAAFKVGNGSTQNQTDITFQNSCIYISRDPLKMAPKSGPGTIRNITFENIDVEYYWATAGKNSRWLSLQLETACHVENVNIRKIRLLSTGEVDAKIAGFDEGHRLVGVNLQDISVNGIPASSLKDLRIPSKTPFVDNLTLTNGSISSR